MKGFFGRRKRRKKRRTAFLKTVIVFMLVFLCVRYSPNAYSNISSDYCLTKNSESAPVFVAHRGLSGMFPQNTTVAFQKADEYGFYGYEFDIHTTKDGEWVVIHDDTVDAMTNGEGNVADFSFEEIRALKIDAGNGIENYPDLKVPTLKEALAICKTSDIVPVIEIKKCDITLLPELKEMLDELSLSERAVIISFDKGYLEEYRKIDGDIKMLYLSSKPSKEDIDWCVANSAGINYNHHNFYKCLGALKYAREKGITIGAWTVDSTILCDIAVLLGAEIITTNKILP